MAKSSIKLIANNKKAYHDYFIEDTYEAGIALAGLGAVLATPMLCFFLGGVSLRFLIAIGFFWSVHHIYII